MKKLLFNRKQILRAIYLACMAAFMMGSAHAQTVIPASVVAPYSADLTGNGSFTTTGSTVSGYKAGESAGWAPSAGGFQGTAHAAGFYTTVAGAVTTVSNLGGATPLNFIETADISSATASGYAHGGTSLLALGNGTTISGYNALGFGYAAGMNTGSGYHDPSGQLSISTQSAKYGAGSNVTVTGPSLTFVAGDVYHYSLQGVYGAGNDLTLTLTVTDLNNPSDTGTLTVDVGTALNVGSNFGVNVSATSISTLTDTISNFSISTVAVPEPSTYALLGAGVGALVLALRRRSKLV